MSVEWQGDCGDVVAALMPSVVERHVLSPTKPPIRVRVFAKDVVDMWSAGHRDPSMG
jgi:2-methylaconitate cis-trans-isomerase PrpF